MDFANVRNTELKTLAVTLKGNGLAASETEAIRMAQSMMGTQKKVQTDFEEKSEALTMDPWERARIEKEKAKQREIEMKELRDKEVKNYIKAQPDVDSVNLESTSLNEVKQANIEMMRKAAVESRPVKIQTHYDTPLNDQQTLEESASETVVMEEPQPDPQPEPDEPPEPEEPAPAIEEEEDEPEDPTPEPAPVEPAPPEPEQPETTRDIPAKPTVVRPKDSFVESQVDLSSVFNFGAR